MAGLFCGEKKLKIVLSEATKKRQPFSPKLLFLLGNLAHQVTRSHCTAPKVVPAPDPAQDHTLQTRTEIPDFVALGFSERRSGNGGGTSKGSHDTKSK